MNYDKMTDQQLISEQERLKHDYQECQSIIKEAFDSMLEFDKEYNAISKILEQRQNNG